MKKQHLLMGAGLAIAAWLALFGDKTPTSRIAEPVMRPSLTDAAATRTTVAPRRATSATVPSTDKREPAPLILALQPRDELIGGIRSTANLFASQNWTPPPPPPPPPKALPSPPPTAPPFPFTYLGKKSEDGRWEVYLARGEQTVIVREQETIDGVYRVDAIQPPQLSLTYMPLQQTQTLAIGDAN